MVYVDGSRIRGIVGGKFRAGADVVLTVPAYVSDDQAGSEHGGYPLHGDHCRKLVRQDGTDTKHGSPKWGGYPTGYPSDHE